MTRFVCIGDIHFGVKGHNEDRYAVLDRILDYGCALDQVGAWLFTGDLNDAKMTIADRNQIAPRLQRAAAVAPVVIVRGNHDYDGDLDIWARLEAEHDIIVVERPQVVTLMLPTGGRAAIFCQPYIFKAGLVSLGVEHQQIGADVRTLLDPIYVAAAAELQEAAAAGCYPLMLGHVNVGGAVVSSGQPVVGTEIMLDAALLDRLGHIPKILGHIHKPQAIHGAYYLGSITRNDFGEREDKAFAVLDYRGVDNWTLTPVPLDVPAMVHIEGTLTRDGFTLTQEDGAPVFDVAACLARCQNAYVRCRYTFNKAETDALDLASLYATFAGCRALKLDPIVQREHTVRAPEIAEAPTLEAKVQAYAARQGIAVTDGLLAKLALLQAADEETVLQQVRSALDAVEAPASPIAEVA